VIVTLALPAAIALLPIGLLMVAAPGVAVESVPAWSRRPLAAIAAFSVKLLRNECSFALAFVQPAVACE
jgi:hypothetical protein